MEATHELTQSSNYSSDRKRAAALVTFTPSAFALYGCKLYQLLGWSLEQADAPLQDGNPVAAAHTMCNLRREAFIVHQQQVHISHIVDKQLL